MAESLNFNRVQFPPGEQKDFLEEMMQILGLTNSGIAKLLNVSVRTLTDWKREKFLMDYKSVQLLSQKTMRGIPSRVQIHNRYWYVNKGAHKGGEATYRKYGRVPVDEEHRLRRWREWWNTEGQYNLHQNLKYHCEKKPINLPSLSIELAEFVGILLGDGGITQYQVIITLHSVDDRQYGEFVYKLAEKLFGVAPSIYPSKIYRANDYVISRKELVELCVRLGLKVGNKIKQNIDIPIWIKENKDFRLACIRGLVDTDGSIVIHRYKVGGKEYVYKKLCFCSASIPLRDSVFFGLKNLGLHPRLAKSQRNIYLDNQADMMHYFEMVGSNNRKHLTRFYG